jgi:hypothetical protein
MLHCCPALGCLQTVIVCWILAAGVACKSLFDVFLHTQKPSLMGSAAPLLTEYYCFMCFAVSGLDLLQERGMLKMMILWKMTIFAHPHHDGFRGINRSVSNRTFISCLQ